MLTLNQVQLLESKVESAVSRIADLNNEKAALLERCSKLESVNNELQKQLSSFQEDQGRIERGILNALDRLASVENTILNSSLDQHIQKESNQIQNVNIQKTDNNISISGQNKTSFPTEPNIQTEQLSRPVENSQIAIAPEQNQTLSATENSPVDNSNTTQAPVAAEQFSNFNNIAASNQQNIPDEQEAEPSENDLFSELTGSNPASETKTEPTVDGEFIY